MKRTVVVFFLGAIGIIPVITLLGFIMYGVVFGSSKSEENSDDDICSSVINNDWNVGNQQKFQQAETPIQSIDVEAEINQLNNDIHSDSKYRDTSVFNRSNRAYVLSIMRDFDCDEETAIMLAESFDRTAKHLSKQMQ